MASMSETSYWISFFTSAGIPAGDAAHYAIMFSDNRITREMLLDLSKEYLTDMGITRLGDIIAILKHAKHVFNQEAKDKILKSTSLTSFSSSNSSSPSQTPRRSTAASRMVNQITSKHPEAAPMSQSPVPKLPPPDPPRSKRKVSVFDRLGADEGEDTVTLAMDSPSLSSSSNAAQSSVFSRLGGKSAMKRPASSTSIEDFDDLLDREGDSLPYAGVLKNTGPSAPKKPNIKVAVTRAAMKTPIKIKKTIKTFSSADEKKASQIQRPEISTTTEGVLSDFAKKETLTLRDRLGAKSEAASSTSNVEKIKVSTTTQKTSKSKGSIQNRLGAKTEESPVVSSTEQIRVNLKKEKEASKAAAKPSGVFSRLGKKSQAS